MDELEIIEAFVYLVKESLKLVFSKEKLCFD